MTPHIDDIRTIRDDVVRSRKGSRCALADYKGGEDEECPCVNQSMCYKRQYLAESGVDDSIPTVEDLDMKDVSRILYSKNVL